MMQSKLVIDNKFNWTFDRKLTKDSFLSFFDFFLFLSSISNYIQFNLCIYIHELQLFFMYRCLLIYINVYQLLHFFLFFYETCCRASERTCRVEINFFFIMLSFLQTAGRQNARVKYNTLCPFYKPNSKRAEAANQYI